MPRKIMSPSEKRRVPTGSGSPSRPGRAPNTAATSTSRGSTSAPTMALAPPPRAALSGTSSPAPDDRRNHNNSNGGNSQLPAPTARPTTPAPSSGDAAAAQKLRDKDLRITELERELVIMEAEFTRGLDKLSKAESESSSYWQAKCGALGRELEGAAAELRALRAAVDAQSRDSGDAQQLRRELRARDDEVADLRRQVRGLKEWVSTSTRSDGAAQVTDEELAFRAKRLGNELQNWVLVNLRRVKIDLSRADESTTSELGWLVPMYEELVVTSKVHLLQSLVSRLLVEMIFDAYFVGLESEQTRQFTHVETFLASFASSPEPINQWRSHTLTILKKEADHRLQEETSRITETIVSKTNRILDAVTDAGASETRDQGLRALVASAVELSRLLVVQRAIFKVAMPEILPHQRTVFDPATMEDLGGEDEEGLQQREICCVAFPGIIKRGDESGGHLQYRNVIAKAKVLCGPE